MLEIQQQLGTRLQQANERAAKQANKRRMEMAFEVGDKVWLSNKHLKTLRQKKKLDYRYRCPLPITEKINEVTYRLQLPEGSKAYDVYGEVCPSE